MRYWLLKSEPDTYSIDDLRAEPDGTGRWDGIRNYQARNLIRDAVRDGDRAFFYHSGKNPGIAGTMRIASAAYPDPTAFDPTSEYFDPRGLPGTPRWYAIDVRFERKWRRVVTLAELRQQPELRGMAVLRRGNRLSITPVTPAEWKIVTELATGR